MVVTIAHFLTSDGAQFAACRAIRNAVFVVEQQVPPADEWDLLEDAATHMLLRVDGVPMGTARVRILETTAKLERIALLKVARGFGYGDQLMQYLLAFARMHHGVNTAKLSAQLYAIPFYERYEFTVCSDTYMDAGIAHQMMVRNIP